MLLFLLGPIMYWSFKDNAKKWGLAKGGDTNPPALRGLFRCRVSRAAPQVSLVWSSCKGNPCDVLCKGLSVLLSPEIPVPQARSLTRLLFPCLRCRPAYGSRPAVWQLHMCQERGDLQPIALPPLQQDWRHLLQGQKCCIRWLWAGSDGREDSRAMWCLCNHCFKLLWNICRVSIL